MKGNNKAVRLYNRLFHSKSQHASIAKKLKNRNHTNLRRKMMHCSFGLLFTSLNHLIPKSTFVPAMTVLSSATLLMELLRYQPGFGWMNDALHWFLGSSLRKHEMEGKFTGPLLFLCHGHSLIFFKPPRLDCAPALADRRRRIFDYAAYTGHIENGLFGGTRILGFRAFFVRPLIKHQHRLVWCSEAVVTQTALLASLLGLGAFADLACRHRP
jgi:hypothetical protein